MSSTTAPAQPEPVLDQAKIASAVTFLFGTVVTLLAAFGVTVDGGDEQTAVTLVTGAFTLVGSVLPYLTALKARAQVTPLASPKTDAGVPLVPAR